MHVLIRRNWCLNSHGFIGYEYGCVYAGINVKDDEKVTEI